MIQHTKPAKRTKNISQMTNGSGTESHASPKTGSRRTKKVTIFVVLLLAAAAIVGLLEMNNGLVSKLLVSFFGPPKVALQESFAEKPDGNKFDHSSFDSLLKENVDVDGWVDYGQLKASSDRLDAYIDTIGNAEIDELGRSERLAFLINAYNAFTLKLIVEHYPLDSIKEISDADRWDAVRWNLAGQTVSLNQIEHELIRPNFKEPRIHFALVCAAIGCPPLSNEAYSGIDLEKQLTRQATYVHQHKTWFDYEVGSGQLKLTQLYKWYGDDFVQVAGSVEKFAATYAPVLQRDLTSGSIPNVQWLDYDWALNDKLKKSAR